ncbi:MAG: hypothetical protein Q8K58_05555 [Acidimicrobiales bacterium]|nr:hypothetical protein [Acidimicrobiales bacterium]
MMLRIHRWRRSSGWKLVGGGDLPLLPAVGLVEVTSDAPPPLAAAGVPRAGNRPRIAVIVSATPANSAT